VFLLPSENKSSKPQFVLCERPGGVNVVRLGKQRRQGGGGGGGGVYKKFVTHPSHQSHIKVCL
jgi:hypothetical protein